MSNLQRFTFSVVVFLVSTGLLVFGSRLLGQSHFLTASVVLGYVVALWAMFPVEAAAVKDEALELLNKWRGK